MLILEQQMRRTEQRLEVLEQQHMTMMAQLDRLQTLHEKGK